MSAPRFVSFSREGRSGYGLVAGEGVIDLSARFAQRWANLSVAVADGALARLVEEAAKLGTSRYRASLMRFPCRPRKKSSASA